MNKSVLIVTPFFAPQSHAPVFRMHKLTRYLPDHGWKPYVLTVDTNYTYNEDKALLDELPREVEIYCAKYIEPTLRGLRMWMGGKDRSFSAQKSNIEVVKDGYSTNSEHTTGVFRKFYSYLLNRHLKQPDAYWPWRITALKKAKKLIKEYDIPIVLTTFPPHTSFVIGAKLQEEMNIKWVADFRDPGTYESRSAPDYKTVYWRQKKIELSTLIKADHKVVTSSVYPMLFNERFSAHRDNYTQIPTGLDEEIIPKQVFKKKNQIVFVGEFLEEYQDTFLKTFKFARESSNGNILNCKLVIVGHEIINRNLLSPLLKRYDLGEAVQFIDHLPQGELYKILKKSKAALLMSGKSRFSCNYAKMVDYIGLQAPVLADVPEISEARNELEKAGIGIFLDGTIEENAKKLTAFMNGKETVNPNKSFCKKYLAGSQTEKFLEVFNRLTN
jgi:glycosyltransferase involved in cell wall biosynthesis